MTSLASLQSSARPAAITLPNPVAVSGPAPRSLLAALEAERRERRSSVRATGSAAGFSLERGRDTSNASHVVPRERMRSFRQHSWCGDSSASLSVEDGVGAEALPSAPVLASSVSIGDGSGDDVLSSFHDGDESSNSASLQRTDPEDSRRWLKVEDASPGRTSDSNGRDKATHVEHHVTAPSAQHHAVPPYLRAGTAPAEVHVPSHVCAVCLDMDTPVDMKLNPCKHEFHAACITQWVAQNFSCPLCRQTIQLFLPLEAEAEQAQQPAPSTSADDGVSARAAARFGTVNLYVS